MPFSGADFVSRGKILRYVAGNVHPHCLGLLKSGEYQCRFLNYYYLPPKSYTFALLQKIPLCSPLTSTPIPRNCTLNFRVSFAPAASPLRLYNHNKNHVGWPMSFFLNTNRIERVPLIQISHVVNVLWIFYKLIFACFRRSLGANF